MPNAFRLYITLLLLRSVLYTDPEPFSASKTLFSTTSNTPRQPTMSASLRRLRRAQNAIGTVRNGQCRQTGVDPNVWATGVEYIVEFEQLMLDAQAAAYADALVAAQAAQVAGVRYSAPEQRFQDQSFVSSHGAAQVPGYDNVDMGYDGYDG